MAEPVLIGEAPSKRGDRFYHFPLSGPPARVLCTLAGIPPEADGSTYGRWTWALYDRFECRNVFERYADATPWSAPRARDRAAALLEEVADGVVVLLGRSVQTAFFQALGSAQPDFYAWTAHERTLVVATPHPSGRNRKLNDPQERDTVGLVLRQAMEIARVRSRLWRLANVGGPDDCWLWTGSTNGVYGDYRDEIYGRRQGAHRWAWEITFGPLPEGMCALHRCDVPLCVNPTHLFEGTLADNNADMAAKGRARPGPGAQHRPGERNPNAKLSDVEAAEIRSSKERGVDLAARYGVSDSLVSLIRSGKVRS